MAAEIVIKERDVTDIAWATLTVSASPLLAVTNFPDDLVQPTDALRLTTGGDDRLVLFRQSAMTILRERVGSL
jgi:hypothetical protein